MKKKKEEEQYYRILITLRTRVRLHNLKNKVLKTYNDVINRLLDLNEEAMKMEKKTLRQDIIESFQKRGGKVEEIQVFDSAQEYLVKVKWQSKKNRRLDE
jgi:hypothetical protein